MAFVSCSSDSEATGKKFSDSAVLGADPVDGFGFTPAAFGLAAALDAAVRKADFANADDASAIRADAAGTVADFVFEGGRFAFFGNLLGASFLFDA